MVLLMWGGTDAWRAESAQVLAAEDRLSATGVQLGVDPVPYRLDYRLETVADWVTAVLDVTVLGDGWRRALRLERDPAGVWSCDAQATGEVDLPSPECDTATLSAALDCDLGLSPLTNTMPMLRHGLHRASGSVDLTMAWVSVPDLGVHPSPQSYEHLRATAEGAVVAFSSGSFAADLTLDADGFVLDYPGLARRVSAAAAR